MILQQAERGQKVCYADGDVETWELRKDLLSQARENSKTVIDGKDGDDTVALQRPSFLFPGLRACPVWPCTVFPTTVSLLEGAASAVRKEVLDLIARIDGRDDDTDDHDEGQVELSRQHEAAWFPQSEGLHEGVWHKLELMAHGKIVAENCMRAPETCKILQSLPDLMREAPGRAAFSLMLPGARVHPHCGPTNHRLRLHLPLLLPGGVSAMTGLTVAGQSLSWNLDKCLIFDDSFEHEVSVPRVPVNAAAALAELARVVLIVDLWHPDAAQAGIRSHEVQQESKPDLTRESVEAQAQPAPLKRQKHKK